MPFKNPRERLAAVHATMWHEAGHVRHPIPKSWHDQLLQRENGPGAGRVRDAFQILEDLRVERELLTVRPQAAVWLRYQLGCRGGLLPTAIKLGKDSTGGWAAAATIYAGRAVAGVIDRNELDRIVGYDKRRLATETNRLWQLWDGYSALADADRDNGLGGPYLIELAHHLPATAI